MTEQTIWKLKSFLQVNARNGKLCELLHRGGDHPDGLLHRAGNQRRRHRHASQVG